MRKSKAQCQNQRLSALDRELAEGLEDIRKGRCYGPFETAEEMIAFLHRQTRSSAKRKNAVRMGVKE